MSQHAKGEHGTTISYVIGFILSLIFTAIPYYMVVNKIVSGTTLLVTILTFAVLQMFIQVFFFLHLGRGPKPLYNVVFFAFTAGTILVVVIGSIWIMNHLNYNMAPRDLGTKLAQDEGIAEVGNEKTGACQKLGVNHKVTIRNGVVLPSHTTAQLCDTLTFLNEDDKVREIGFGSHPNHTGYGGEDDLLVYKGRGKTLTLNQAGTYDFHDHLEEEVTGSFTVIK